MALGFACATEGDWAGSNAEKAKLTATMSRIETKLCMCL
jgi:hypothetical protein